MGGYEKINCGLIIMKKALITGISGQDGFFLTRLLLSKGYQVHGIIRRNSQKSMGTLSNLSSDELEKLKVHWGDITDNFFIENLIRGEKFDEVYHLAAQSFVSYSFQNPKYTYDVNIGGTLNLLNSIKCSSPTTKLYFAATSEMFGKTGGNLMNEQSPFHPRSPYGVSKLAGFWSVKNYRESYNLFLASGILFNHESEIRGPEFVTRKIVKAAIAIKKGEQDCLYLGNINSMRDWGYAKDYVEGMWLMLQQESADDFVLATGVSVSVRDFVNLTFKNLGLTIQWEGEGLSETGYCPELSKIIVRIDPKFYRPAEVDHLLGDSTKAKNVLGWIPKTDLNGLVRKMISWDIND